jgi:hypothetical protein
MGAPPDAPVAVMNRSVTKTVRCHRALIQQDDLHRHDAQLTEDERAVPCALPLLASEPGVAVTAGVHRSMGLALGDLASGRVGGLHGALS